MVEFSFAKDDIAALNAHTPANYTAAENGRIAGLEPEVFAAAKDMVSHVTSASAAGMPTTSAIVSAAEGIATMFASRFALDRFDQKGSVNSGRRPEACT